MNRFTSVKYSCGDKDSVPALFWDITGNEVSSYGRFRRLRAGKESISDMTTGNAITKI